MAALVHLNFIATHQPKIIGFLIVHILDGKILSQMPPSVVHSLLLSVCMLFIQSCSWSYFSCAKTPNFEFVVKRRWPADIDERCWRRRPMLWKLVCGYFWNNKQYYKHNLKQRQMDLISANIRNKSKRQSCLLTR